MGLWRQLFKLLRKPNKNEERIIVTLFSHVIATHNQKQFWYIRLRVADEKRTANPSSFTTRKCKHQNETQKSNKQPIQRTSIIEYSGRGSWPPE